MDMISLDSNYEFMFEAIEEAKKASEMGEVPVGAVLTIDNKIVSRAHNSPINDNDPSSHAEMNAIRNYSKIQSNYRIHNATLYVTLEPCLMCYGAIIHSRISKIVFGAYDKKSGVCGSCLDLENSICLNHKPKIIGGVLSEECSKILKDFFKERRI